MPIRLTLALSSMLLKTSEHWSCFGILSSTSVSICAWPCTSINKTNHHLSLSALTRRANILSETNEISNRIADHLSIAHTRQVLCAIKPSLET